MDLNDIRGFLRTRVYVVSILSRPREDRVYVLSSTRLPLIAPTAFQNAKHVWCHPTWPSSFLLKGGLSQARRSGRMEPTHQPFTSSWPQCFAWMLLCRRCLEVRDCWFVTRRVTFHYVAFHRIALAYILMSIHPTQRIRAFTDAS